MYEGYLDEDFKQFPEKKVSRKIQREKDKLSAGDLAGSKASGSQIQGRQQQLNRKRASRIMKMSRAMNSKTSTSYDERLKMNSSAQKTIRTVDRIKDRQTGSDTSKGRPRRWSLEPKLKDKKESFEIDPKKFKKAKTAAKIGNLYRNTENKGEKKAAESKLKGPKLFGEKTTMTTVPLRDRKKINDRYKDLHKADPDGTIPEQLTFEGWREKAADAIKKVTKKKETPKHDYGRDVGAEARKKLDHNRRKKDHETVNFLDPDD